MDNSKQEPGPVDKAFGLENFASSGPVQVQPMPGLFSLTNLPRKMCDPKAFEKCGHPCNLLKPKAVFKCYFYCV